MTSIWWKCPRPARDAERGSIETLQNLQLMAGNGKAIPLGAIVNFHYELEPPIVWRRNRLPTVTVRANILGPTQPATIVQQLSGRVDEFKRTLPAGYRLEIGGPVESESARTDRGRRPADALRDGHDPDDPTAKFSTIVHGHRGLIGVVAALLPSNSPMGLSPSWESSR